MHDNRDILIVIITLIVYVFLRECFSDDTVEFRGLFAYNIIKWAMCLDLTSTKGARVLISEKSKFRTAPEIL